LHVPGSTVEINPSTPNLHSIESLEDNTLLLDVIGPPYGSARECTYYRVVGDEIWDVGDEEELDCVWREYHGIKAEIVI
jgi:hypothetical protein